MAFLNEKLAGKKRAVDRSLGQTAGGEKPNSSGKTAKTQSGNVRRAKQPISLTYRLNRSIFQETAIFIPVILFAIFASLR